MGKMGYAPGLIRYSTENGVAKGWTRAQMMRRALRPRVLLYAAALLLVSGAFVISLSMRSGFSVDVFKDRGALAREIQGGVIENTYTLHLSNLSEQPRQYRLAVSGLPGLELRSAARLDVGAMANRTWPVQLALPPQAAQSLRGRAHAIEFEVSTGDGAEARTRREKATFYVPR